MATIQIKDILMDKQTCKVCGEEKILDDFATGKNIRNGITKTYHYKTCKLCDKNRVLTKSYRYKEKNRVKIANIQRQYHSSHKLNDSLTKQKWYQDNKEAVKLRIKNNIYSKRVNDPIFRLKESISERIRKSIFKGRKSVLKYLNYSIYDLKNHIEKQFEPWMSWNNFGKYDFNTWDDNNPNTWKWNVDHIIPHSTFKYSSMEDDSFKKCWALENLRPYSAKQNIADGNRR
jgi:hypothetical protein